MVKFSKIDLEFYNYRLQQSKIAVFPLENKINSKLLCINVLNSQIMHHIFKELPELLPENSMLIINDTKVIPARLFFSKPTGGIVELLLIEPVEPSGIPQIAMLSKKNCVWKCMIGGKRIKTGMILSLFNKGNDKDIKFSAEIIKRTVDETLVDFKWEPEEMTFAALLDLSGKTPLPPYIKREAVPSDKENYQTVYATRNGSVAAPTAGFHFSENILTQIANKGIKISEVTLHIGQGTFKPIDTYSIEQHVMHSETIFITKKIIEDLIDAITYTKKIISVGTTSLRVLESIYWLGVKLINDNSEFRIQNSELKNDFFFSIEQWEPYQNGNETLDISQKDALKAVYDLFLEKNIEVIQGRTQLFIVPGYKFKFVDGLITNFHLPKSTLILLVAAFIGDELWKRAYEEALQNDYRFLSYGDATLCLR